MSLQGYACNVWTCRWMLLACIFRYVDNSYFIAGSDGDSTVVHVDLVHIIFVQENFIKSVLCPVNWEIIVSTKFLICIHFVQKLLDTS